MSIDVIIISSGIPLSQIFVSKVICILESVHHDVVVTSGGSWSMCVSHHLSIMNKYLR